MRFTPSACAHPERMSRCDLMAADRGVGFLAGADADDRQDTFDASEVVDVARKGAGWRRGGGRDRSTHELRCRSTNAPRTRPDRSVTNVPNLHFICKGAVLMLTVK